MNSKVFVSGIGHHDSKRLYEKGASSSPNFMCLNWRSDSTQCLTISFQSFANGIQVSNRNAASEIHSGRISLHMLKAKLMEIIFIYRVMHACIEFKLKISDRKKSFPCFFDNPN